MTENEKVKKWFKTELSMRIEESLDAIDCEDVMDICIKALEEIQQYREIGTVEKIKEELDKLRNDNECQGLYFTLEERKALAKQSRELSEYKAIGTIEEFNVLKNTDIPIIHGKAELDLNDNEVRNKAIDEFVKRLYKIGEHREFDWEDIYKLADQLKGGAE